MMKITTRWAFYDKNSGAEDTTLDPLSFEGYVGAMHAVESAVVRKFRRISHRIEVIHLRYMYQNGMGGRTSYIEVSIKMPDKQSITEWFLLTGSSRERRVQMKQCVDHLASKLMFNLEHLARTATRHAEELREDADKLA